MRFKRKPKQNRCRIRISTAVTAIFCGLSCTSLSALYFVLSTDSRRGRTRNVIHHHNHHEGHHPQQISYKKPEMVVTVATHPRCDLLGAFTLPTLMLLAVANKHGWNLEILPVEGSEGEEQLKEQFQQGHSIDRQWGSGFIDANHRRDYDPVENNRVSHKTLGFFPEPAKEVDESKWIEVIDYPPPGKKLDRLCRRGAVMENGILQCRMWLRWWWIDETKQHDHDIIQHHILANGGFDSFFTHGFRQELHSQFMKKNRKRVTHFSDSTYDVAVHVRRGDEVQSVHPQRWIEQPVYANVIRRICRRRPDAIIHIFSAGNNADGGWDDLEKAKDVCGTMVYHLDEVEFDTWAHFATADEFVMSKSTFSYVPALFAAGHVHYPSDYWFGRLGDWSQYDSETGEEVFDEEDGSDGSSSDGSSSDGSSSDDDGSDDDASYVKLGRINLYK